jgi:glycosyltransferase involved in cell wall biosynthesis
MRLPPPDELRVAYLASYYPLLSQQFVRREVEALRRAGVRIRTVAVRPTPPEQIRSAADRAARAETPVLLDGGKAALLRDVAALAIRRPRAFGKTLRLARRSGASGLRSKLWQLFYLVEAVRLVRILSADGIRHVHVHFANNAADVARLATHLGSQLDGRPWTWSLSMHGPTEFMEVGRFDLAAKVRAAAFVACISDFARSQLMALVEPDQWPKLAVVHMGVDLTLFGPAAGERAARPDGPVRVLFVGRLVPEKGVPVLIDATQELVRRGCPVEVRVAGDSPLRDALAKVVADRGIGDVLTFLGPVSQDELPGLYAWADLFCLPSFAEGVPVVLMEAMATELPVVTTAIAGIPELVRDGRTGVLVPPGRADRVADAIEALGRDADRRRRLGESGRELVVAEYDAATAALALLPLFAGAVA